MESFPTFCPLIFHKTDELRRKNAVSKRGQEVGPYTATEVIDLLHEGIKHHSQGQGWQRLAVDF